MASRPRGPVYSGAATYYDAFPNVRETEPRIYVEFRPQGLAASFLALLDTGAHYCILSPDVREAVEDLLTDHLGRQTLRTSRGSIAGELYILPIQLLAEEGEHLDLEVIAFVSEEWQGQSFLGYTGVLDRLCFGIDPHANRFYFGLIP